MLSPSSFSATHWYDPAVVLVAEAMVKVARLLTYLVVFSSFLQLTEAGGTGAHAEARNLAPDVLRRHADEMRQLVRDLQPEERVAVANATVAKHGLGKNVPIFLYLSLEPS